MGEDQDLVHAHSMHAPLAVSGLLQRWFGRLAGDLPCCPPWSSTSLESTDTRSDRRTTWIHIHFNFLYPNPHRVKTAVNTYITHWHSFLYRTNKGCTQPSRLNQPALCGCIATICTYDPQPFAPKPPVVVTLCFNPSMDANAPGHVFRALKGKGKGGGILSVVAAFPCDDTCA